MNLVYYKFLFATTIKKRPVWITWLLYLFTATMFIIVLPVAARINPYHVWANTTMAVCQSFLGMAVALFTSVLAINVFKDSNEEGTELIIISKPISRPKIILTKFLLFGTMCLIVNLTAVVLSMFTIFIPGTEKEFYWGLVVSMLIGNLVAFAVFGSIAILLSVKFAKVGIIITNIILSLVFLVYQSLTLFVFSTPLKKLTSDGITPITCVYAERKLEDPESDDYATYKEKNFVYLDIEPNERGEFAPKPKHDIPFNWKDVVDYWEDDVKGKDPSTILNITDLAGQVSLSYLSVGVNKYSQREANRMFAISRFYNYNLTYPVSPEIINPGEYRTIDPDKKPQQPFPMVYYGVRPIDYEDPDDPDIKIHFFVPINFFITGIRSTKEASLAGTYANKIPVGYIRTKELFSSRDVYFESEQWQKYREPFEIMYDNVFNGLLQNGLGEPYYKQEAVAPDDKLNMWCQGNDNIARYYELIWACLTGNSAQNKYFGSRNPMGEFGKEYFDIHSIHDLNDRFIQFKHYCFYRAYEKQNELLNSQPTGEEATAKAAALTELNQEVWFSTVVQQENSWMMTSNDEAYLHVLESGTQSPNITLLSRTKDKLTTDEQKTNCAFAQYKLTGKIADTFCDPRETYLFKSLDVPSRDATYSGEWYDQRHTWQLYLENELASIIGLYIPWGQNTEFFFFEINKTLEFWMYAVIWLIISSGLFCTGVVVYNRFDVK